ncbi:MAG: hypothetical protein E4H20_11820, partial [Spirochaetales bacterium]
MQKHASRINVLHSGVLFSRKAYDMKLFEYQAKDAFEAEGIPVPVRRLCQSADEVAKVTTSLGVPCVVKSQVLSGGRGKAGLVRVVHSVAEASSYSAELLSGP